MRSAILAPGLALLAACGHSHHGGGTGTGVPVFLEAERNDDPLSANDFGHLRPGDHFFIDGFVRDDLADPFDAFAFTADVPLHVDFELVIRNAAADLDVCLYDPQIDQTVACFATSDNPERGGVDVFAGGLDFHLVVESFLGDATYSLEIVVLPLFGREAQRAEGAPLLAGSGAAGERVPRAKEAYGLPRPEPEPRLLFESVIEVDLERGIALRRDRLLR